MDIRRQQGLGIVELLIITIIMAILAVIAIPSFISFMQQYRVTSTMEFMFYNLQFARSEALKQSTSVYVSFQTGSSWCYGINTNSSCTCTTPSSCNLGTYSTPNTNTSLSLSGFTSPIIFDGTRGTMNVTGTITLTSGSKSMGIDVSKAGTVLLCSTTVSGYPTC